MMLTIDIGGPNRPLSCPVYTFFPLFNTLDFVLPRIPGISYGNNTTSFMEKHKGDAYTHLMAIFGIHAEAITHGSLF
jgi:hypothetical protein